MNHALRTFAALWLAWAGLSAADDAAVPYLTGHVVDEAEIMTAHARDASATCCRRMSRPQATRSRS